MVKRKMQLILLGVLVIVSLVGCSKGGDKEKLNSNSSQQENVDHSDKGKDNVDDNKKIDIYEDVMSCEYRSSDIESVFRNPSKYTAKQFTLSGAVLKSKTSKDGKQVVTVQLSDGQMYTRDKDFEDGKIVKLEYNIEDFGGERLVESEAIAVCVEFQDIENDEEHGDIAKFNVLKKLRVIDYLSSLALDYYYNSIGVDVKDLGIELKEFEYDEYNEFMEKNDGEYSYYGNEDNSVFETKNGSYWLIMFTSYRTSEYSPTDGELQLFYGEPDNDGKINFQLKEEVYVDTYDI